MPNDLIVPYRVDVPQSALDDLAERLDRAKLDEVGAERLDGLLDRWRDGYDWRVWESRINAHPQFTTEIDGLDVHFLHVRSPRPDAFPLILSHGWPGSVVEFLDLLVPLAADFHLVVPSLPGFGFSGPADGWDRHRTARAWAELMRRLGYDRYGAVGNDLGSTVSLELGRTAADHVTGVLVTQIFSMPAGADEPLTEDDADRLAHSQRFIQRHGAYLRLHATRPDLLAPALTDSPVGLAAWNAQLLDAVDPDFALTNITLYWLTGTGASSIRFYAHDARAVHPTTPTTTPVALSEYTGDYFRSVRRYASRDHSAIVSWTTHPGGGHFAAHQAPDALLNDIRAFFEVYGDRTPRP
ncbi:epoxide hydrolase [Actinomadura logoneensis]|uniref:Epoxide hydrolase n=1 Tax=Actinomadura logoneensis TaxID=2293572 RepID=A0A372JJD1_9ACTN|nr:epoxide hydrolase family protein [Actinomadura logoneensis]RFU40039.1 epoxide hydrolase [Actinomadura logoneensis]